jgi:hypothetical protein
MAPFIGTLSISEGVSDLDGTTLAKAPLTGNPFGRATNFLRQDRNLNSGDHIQVEGTDGTSIGNVPVIMITNAGLAMHAAGASVGALMTALSTTKNAAAKKVGDKQSRAKKSATKKSGAAAKPAAKKSTGKNRK